MKLLKMTDRNNVIAVYPFSSPITFEFKFEEKINSIFRDYTEEERRNIKHDLLNGDVVIIDNTINFKLEG
jgi:hypothetical protein